MESKTAKRLTSKQEAFVRNIVDGMSQREAYRHSYNTDRMSEKTIDENACRLFNNSKVLARYNEIQEKLTKETIMTAQERLEYLTGIVKETQKEKISIVKKGEVITVEVPASLGNKLKALDQMNKMQGSYITRVEGNVTMSRLEDLI